MAGAACTPSDALARKQRHHWGAMPLSSGCLAMCHFQNSSRLSWWCSILSRHTRWLVSRSYRQPTGMRCNACHACCERPEMHLQSGLHLCAVLRHRVPVNALNADFTRLLVALKDGCSPQVPSLDHLVMHACSAGHVYNRRGPPRIECLCITRCAHSKRERIATLPRVTGGLACAVHVEASTCIIPD